MISKQIVELPIKKHSKQPLHELSKEIKTLAYCLRLHVAYSNNTVASSGIKAALRKLI